jgi:hypothetical protein
MGDGENVGQGDIAGILLGNPVGEIFGRKLGTPVGVLLGRPASTWLTARHFCGYELGELLSVFPNRVSVVGDSLGPLVGGALGVVVGTRLCKMLG